MSFCQRIVAPVKTLVLVLLCLASPALLAEPVEQKVWIKPIHENGQCRVTAYFKGDQDNCSAHDAHGRSDCPKDTGCVCTRQERHITWEMEGSDSFALVFDQGSANPFVEKGDSDCNFKSNKKGKLRCRVKGKDTPRGIYSYSVQVPNCETAKLQVKIF